MHRSPAAADVEAVSRLEAVPKILDTVVHLTGMRFVAVARVTDADWTACAVHDAMGFGLAPGDELELGTTLCDQVRQQREPVVFGHASRHPLYAEHPTPRRYGLESYISVPIQRGDGRIFGTLCAIDSRPADLDNPGILRTFELFADLIGTQLDAEERLAASESALTTALDVAQVRERLIAEVSQDFKAPIQAVLMDAYLIRERAGDDPELRARVRAIEANAWTMATLLDDIVDVSHRRLSDGVPLVQKSAEHITQECERVVAQVAARHPLRPLAASIEIRHPVDCDLPRIGQLLVILATHALAHGDVRRTARIDARTDGTTLRLSALLAGGDFGPEAFARLFEPALPLARRADGAQDAPGWDLFIAAEIARAHGGRLDTEVDSAGTQLVFSMPCRADRKVPASEAPGHAQA